MIEELTLESEAQAVAAAKVAGATHYDALRPLKYWRAGRYAIEWAVYEDGRLGDWQPYHQTRIPEWCGVIR